PHDSYSHLSKNLLPGSQTPDSPTLTRCGARACVQISSVNEHNMRKLLDRRVYGNTAPSDWHRKRVCRFFSLSCPLENSSQTRSHFSCLLLTLLSPHGPVIMFLFLFFIFHSCMNSLARI
ncbi:mCG146026, partial [Mus musculus]